MGYTIIPPAEFSYIVGRMIGNVDLGYAERIRKIHAAFISILYESFFPVQGVAFQGFATFQFEF